MRSTLDLKPLRACGFLFGLGLLLAGGLFVGTSTAWAEDNEEPAAPTPAPEEQPGGRKPILPDVKANPKVCKSLILAARDYFDLEKETWRGRKAFLDGLVAEAEAGKYWMKDLDALRWLIYQGRSFYPPMTDRKWRASMGIPEYKGLGGTLHWIKSEMITIGFSVPKKYPKPKNFTKDFPRIEPYPLLLTMHDKEDYTGQKYPAETLFKRRYPKKDWKELYETWIALCPIAAAGNYLNKEGMIRAEVFQGPYAQFWKHYHIDFDRVILDGTEQAFEAASSQAIFFAGIVFRHGRKKWELADDKMKADVKNFANVPVYVVDNPKLAEQLKEAGHANVTTGVGGGHLWKWMNERKREEPTKFDWNVQRFDQVLPYWVNLEGTNWEAPKRSIQVEVKDTESEPNTITIDATGIQRLALFLNDEVVDLDRPVRVVINGNIEFDGKVEVQNEMMKKIGRDFDLLFDRDPTRIRHSMFFGWLKSARIVNLEVRARKKKEEPTKTEAANEGPPASEEEETKAKRFMAKAKRFLEKGLNDKAKENLQKILDLPRNAQSAEARKMMAELDG